MNIQPLEFDFVKPKLKSAHSYLAFFLVLLGSIGLLVLSLYNVSIFLKNAIELTRLAFDLLIWVIAFAMILVFFLLIGKLGDVFFPVVKTGSLFIGENYIETSIDGVRQRIVFETLEHLHKIPSIGYSRFSPVAFNLKFVYKDYKTSQVNNVKANNEKSDLTSVLHSHKELQRLQIEVL